MKSFPLITALISLLAFHLQASADNVHAYSAKDIDGKDVALSSYKGKVLLIVNTASKCGFTQQYADLVRLQDRYGPDRFLVLGFPANNFGWQEPGSNASIKEFCSSRFAVDFPMFEKVDVKGKDQHPLFAYLTSAPNPDREGKIKWNFEKFLVDQNGKLVRRFGSRTNPAGTDVTDAIDRLLGDGEGKE